MNKEIDIRLIPESTGESYYWIKVKDVEEYIQELEDFLLADIPSKIFPKEKVNGKNFIREDYFKNIKEVEKYIMEHFKILNKQINGK